MSDRVLDASALLAAINDEPGGERVLHYLAESACVASSVNIAEVVARLSERGGPDETIAAIITGLDIEIAPFYQQDALASGLLRVPTKAAGLSIGDRACLVLARKLGVAAVTADRAWAGLLDDVEIELLR